MIINYTQHGSVLDIEPCSESNKAEIRLHLKSINIPYRVGRKYIKISSKFKPVIHLYKT